ncbi:NUDIX hydrolase [Streptomyces hesseae]|uniref:NUDIX hydrolase n=1 Tax=Streptomyces hesseae TaxID=3075519 RepID=A0ABU2SVM9_9ACTN|nr:NUDIX hydrolase [Streptomyces sp. DSM 40473]MDT0451964.1 NUDIX hydrolase [Streptomyces sp. DSM 40473]
MTHTPPAGHPITASVLITNPQDRVLIVHPAKADAPWALPGGVVELGESPLDAARREVREELGLVLDVQTHDLFAVEWLEATRPGRRDRLVFVFAGPQLSPADHDRITLQYDEIDAWRWEPPTSALRLLHPRIAARIVGPLQYPRPTTYLETRTQERTP